MDRLINKSYKDYEYISRYVSFPYYYNVNDKKYMYSTMAQVNQNINYSLHKVKRNETLDSIALDYYNNPTFFWALAFFNNIEDVFAELKEGSELKIPTLSEISFQNN